MFDISFTELLVIGVVALIVIGPERLPRVARTAGHLLGRLQRYVNDVRSDISREIHLDELKKAGQEMQDAARSFETQVTQEARGVEGEVRATANALEQGVEEVAATASPAAPAAHAETPAPAPLPAAPAGEATAPAPGAADAPKA